MEDQHPLHSMDVGAWTIASAHGLDPGCCSPAALANHAEDLGRSYVGMLRTSSRLEIAGRYSQDLVQSVDRGDLVLAGTKGFIRKGGGSLRSRHPPIRHLSPRHALHALTSAYI